MTTALLSNFDRLSPSQRAKVDHWIIDDPNRLSGGCAGAAKPNYVITWTKEDMLQADAEWDKENEEIGR